MLRHHFIRFAAVTAAFVLQPALQPVAKADLGWFDLPLKADVPHVTFGEMIAWSDACLAITDAEWPAVERLYADYLAKWKGEDGDEDILFNGLHSVLGANRALAIDTFRECAAAVMRSRDESDRHCIIRRTLMELAATRGPLAVDSQRVAHDLAKNIFIAVRDHSHQGYNAMQAMREAGDVRAAIKPLYGTLVAVAGEERANAVFATLVQSYEITGEVALSTEFRAIVAHASKLSPDEREALATAYQSADARLRSAEAIENSRDLRAKIDDELFTTITGILGEQRAKLLRGLATGAVDTQAFSPENIDPGAGTSRDAVNGATDVLLEQFVDPSDFEAVAHAGGRRFWQPIPHPLMLPIEAPAPEPMDVAFLAAIAGAKGDDDLAIIEALHADHAQRWAQIEHTCDEIVSRDDRIMQLTDLTIDEDARTLTELQGVFGADRVNAGNVALARFTRLERILSFAKIADRFDTLSRIPWPTGSIGCAVLGVRLPGAPVLPDSRIAGLRALVAASAEALVAGRLESWRQVCNASKSFDRVVAEQRELQIPEHLKLQAIQKQRLASLADCAEAARRTYAAPLALIDSLAGDSHDWEAQFIALTIIERGLEHTDAGRRLEQHLQRTASPEMLDKARVAQIPFDPRGSDLLRACGEAAVAAGNMDDGDLGRIEAGNVILQKQIDTRRRLDRALRAQIAVAWRQLRAAGDPAATKAFDP